MNEESGHKRKFLGFILKPLIQTKLGLYCIALSVLLVLSLGLIIYSNFADLVESILLLTDAPREVQSIFADYWQSTQGWIYLTLLAYVAATVGVSAWYTHRFVGPAIAFKKHLEEIAVGNYSFRTSLRKGDAFEDVAKALNRASEVLEKEGH